MSGHPYLTDEQLRALVRDAVARHLGQPASAAGSHLAGAFAGGEHQSGPHHAGAFAGGEHQLGAHHAATFAAGAGAGSAGPLPLRAHPSHGRYALSSGGDDEGACLIEPNVRCTHCGYCQSHGH